MSGSIGYTPGGYPVWIPDGPSTCYGCGEYYSDYAAEYEAPDSHTYCTRICALRHVGSECLCCGELHFLKVFCIDCESLCARCNAPLIGHDYATLPGDAFPGQMEPWTDNAGRPRVSVAYVGEAGIKAGIPYRLDDQGRFVEVTHG